MIDFDLMARRGIFGFITSLYRSPPPFGGR